MSEANNYYIDTVDFFDGDCIIRGWILYKNTLDIKIATEAEPPLEYTFTTNKRLDVIRSLGLGDEYNKMCGFKIEIKRLNLAYINLVLIADGLKYSEDLHVTSFNKPEQNLSIANIKKGFKYLKRHGFKKTLKRFNQRMHKEDGGIDYDADWLPKHLPSKTEIKKQRKTVFNFSPLISIVIPLYKTPENFLIELVDSIKDQTYSNWELCLSDGSGENSPLEKLLTKLQQSDSRIKVVQNNKQLHISDNTNEAIKIATGDYIGFADHDDLLTPDALFTYVKALNEDNTLEIFYSDEDKIEMDEKKFFFPHFKPDFSIDFLRSNNYICHFFMVKRTIIDKVGMLRSEYNGSQDYDFILRCVEATKKIYHAPRILYHWRCHKDSTAGDPKNKMYCFEAGRAALQAHYDRLNIPAKAVMIQPLGFYKTYYHWDSKPLVSIIIPNKDHISDLKQCIESINTLTYDNYEVIIIENNSEKNSTFSYYEELEKTNKKVKVIHYSGIFNYSKINNFGVENCNGEYLLFLNNDTKFIRQDSIEQMLGYCMREDVGIVGARLYYYDDTIQHAGVIVGLGGVANHAFVGADAKDYGYFGRIILPQNYSVVTAACLMTKKEVFNSVAGFDENLAVAFNDVDFCLRVRQTNKLVVYQPDAELYHFESKSRGLENTSEKLTRFEGEIDYFTNRWEAFILKGDPYYNPNLTLSRSDFSLKELS